MVRHAWEEHAGQKPDFLMSVKSRHKKALDRLVQEAINIVSLSRGPQDEDLNSRSEWGQARFPRITMTMPHQGRPGSNPNEDSNPQFRVYLAAVNAAERAGGKRKVTIGWNTLTADTSGKDENNSEPELETTLPHTDPEQDSKAADHNGKPMKKKLK